MGSNSSTAGDPEALLDQDIERLQHLLCASAQSHTVQTTSHPLGAHRGYTGLLGKWGQANPVTCLAVLRNGTVVTGSSDPTLAVWNPSTGEMLNTFALEGFEATALAVLGNGSTLAVALGANLILVDATTGVIQSHLLDTDCTRGIHHMRVLGDGATLATKHTALRQIALWDTGDLAKWEGGGQAPPGAKMFYGNTRGKVTSFEVIGDGITMAVGHAVDMAVNLWNTAEDTITRRIDNLSCRCMRVLGDGTTLATSGNLHKLHLCDTETGTVSTFKGEKSELAAQNNFFYEDAGDCVAIGVLGSLVFMVGWDGSTQLFNTQLAETEHSQTFFEDGKNVGPSKGIATQHLLPLGDGVTLAGLGSNSLVLYSVGR